MREKSGCWRSHLRSRARPQGAAGASTQLRPAASQPARPGRLVDQQRVRHAGLLDRCAATAARRAQPGCANRRVDGTEPPAPAPRRPAPAAVRGRHRRCRSAPVLRARAARYPARTRSKNAARSCLEPIDAGRRRACARARPCATGRSSSSVQIGLQIRVHRRCERLDAGRINATPVALVGARGIREAIADHPLAARQRRSNQVLQVDAARREHQQGLGRRQECSRPAPAPARVRARPAACRRAHASDAPRRLRDSSQSRTKRATVDLPAPSMPSRVMKRPGLMDAAAALRSVLHVEC